MPPAVRKSETGTIVKYHVLQTFPYLFIKLVRPKVLLRMPQFMIKIKKILRFGNIPDKQIVYE